MCYLTLRGLIDSLPAKVALRGRSVIDNAKTALAKQDELKKRDKKQKRDDLCEMLGRGC